VYSADSAASAFSTTPRTTEAPVKGYQSFTKPSGDVTVSFGHPGRVVKVLAAMSDEVTEGQLLAQQDDEEEQAAKEQDRLAAESEIEIKAEEAIRDQKAKDVEKYKSFGSTFEYENAVLELKIEEAKIEVAKLHHEQAKAKYKQSSVLVEKFKIYAPINGVIEKEYLKAGESAEGGNTKLVRIVQNNPLWIDVPVPSVVARKLVPGAPVNVTFKEKGLKDRTAKVKAISVAADAPSETLLVRLEVPNPQKLASGELNPDKLGSGDVVFVNFPSSSGDVARP
jgi:RND family efflux transporter MFP subunit